MGAPMRLWRHEGTKGKRPANGTLSAADVRAILYTYAWSIPARSAREVAEELGVSTQQVQRIVARETYADVRVDEQTAARLEERREANRKIKPGGGTRAVTRPDPPFAIPSHEEAVAELGDYYETAFQIDRHGVPGHAVGALNWFGDWLGYDRPRNVDRAMAAETTQHGRALRALAYMIRREQVERIRGRVRVVPDDGPRAGFARFAR